MSKPYPTNDKIIANDTLVNIWTGVEAYNMTEKFYEKGYIVNCFSRYDNNGVYRNAWIVDRDEAPIFMEAIFRNRITVEVHAEKSYRVAIIFLRNKDGYDPSYTEVKKILRHIPKNKGVRV